MFLKMKCPYGGRPQNDILFKVDPEESILAYRIGWVKCPSCNRDLAVSINRHELDIFSQSVFNTVHEKQHWNLKEGLAKWLHKQANKVEKQKELVLTPEGNYIRQ